ncbi:SDR family NAD(P)-dependent oxidoreductase [Caenimonas sedimenti]|uniref:SDR family NAD(P)-dependent oxidoreductase n=1 Tax=Caenimonas sedimenti TaxID=2596921 RepID=A0A562ZSA0_9BURK|nr:SDR family NAD(P)-dependent oxidoreductase [Caenimonas sedimenti]
MRMKERVVIVTGAARGLGRGFAERLAAEGAAVVCGDLRPCEETVAAIRGAGGRAMAVRLDVTDMASCLASAETAVAEFGRLDGLVNNAALYADIKGARFDQIEEKQWDAVMNVNVKGIWQMCKAAVPHAQDRRRQHRQHLVAGRRAWHGVCHRLRRVQGGGHRHHALPGARTGARLDSRQFSGAVAGADRGNDELLRRKARAGDQGHRRKSGVATQPGGC